MKVKGNHRYWKCKACKVRASMKYGTILNQSNIKLLSFIHLAHCFTEQNKNYSQTSKRGTTQSAPEYSLFLKKPPTVNKKFWPPLNLFPKKTLLILAFRIDVTFDVKIVWFGPQVAVCVQKRQKNAIFRCSWFQKFNFDCWLLKLLICSPTTENIIKFVFRLLTQSSIMISGT